MALTFVSAAVIFAGVVGGWVLLASGSSRLERAAARKNPSPSTSTRSPASTTTSPGPTTSTSSTTTITALTTTGVSSTTAGTPTTGVAGIPAGPFHVAGTVTAVGDSVMIDYEIPLQQDIPGIDVEATVSRQWNCSGCSIPGGVQLVEQLRSEGRLGSTLIVGLGTNGPISAADFDAMMAVASGCQRVVFVNDHMGAGTYAQSWQDSNNAVIAAGVARYHNAVLVDWNALADQHPEYFGSGGDGTHLPIDGTGAQALAALVAAAAAG